MQLSGTFPQLSDNQKKSVRKQIRTASPLATQKGGAIGGSTRRHAGSLTANRDQARKKARGT